MMNNDRNPFVVLSWVSESSVVESGEPDDFLYEVDGNVLGVDDNDDRFMVGKFRIYYVNVAQAMDRNMSVFDVFDLHAHTVGYYDAIFGNHYPDFTEKVMKVLEYDVVDSNILILDRLELLPKYRGQGLGLKIICHIIKRFSMGTALVATKPFPLQFENKSSNEDDKKWRAELKLAQLPKNELLATKKLSEHYGKLGFRKISRTPYMLRSTAWILPDIESVIG